MADEAALPELVRDSRLQASSRGDVTVHTRPPGRRGVSRQESWVRDRILGSGGYGTVWLEKEVKTAGEHRDASAARLRAVKCVEIPAPNSQRASGKYVRELEALAKFSQNKYSEHFVKFFGWYEVSGFLHIAMEYCEYGDLKSYLSDNKTMPENQVQDITLQVAGALSLMHGERFAHRDLKPANILIKCKPPDHWWVKVADLGLSKRAESDMASTTIRGTESFMAPETRGFPFIGDPMLANPFAADMWSLGEVVFRALSGRATFADPQALSDYQKKEAGFPTHVLRDSNVTPAAESFVLALMSANPSARMTADETLQHPWLGTHADPTLQVPSRPFSDSRLPVSAFLGEITEPSGEWTATLSRRGAALEPSLEEQGRGNAAPASRTMSPRRSPVFEPSTPAPDSVTRGLLRAAPRRIAPSSDERPQRFFDDDYSTSEARPGPFYYNSITPPAHEARPGKVRRSSSRAYFRSNSEVPSFMSQDGRQTTQAPQRPQTRANLPIIEVAQGTAWTRRREPLSSPTEWPSFPSREEAEPRPTQSQRTSQPYFPKAQQSSSTGVRTREPHPPIKRRPRHVYDYWSPDPGMWLEKVRHQPPSRRYTSNGQYATTSDSNRLTTAKPRHSGPQKLDKHDSSGAKKRYTGVPESWDDWDYVSMEL
ncbi:kinase-like domain-containing protein [Podospora aff. communis PSN243]|uniref:non-specific serine/threonine protein kinase n=1 Tax=Podospora aff. communis PSN243 TaxID=3040156 RepID=A0AAV9GY08_9PEZI|nr:kinase-like domain-containing protein [Podospora aff. communis PSN243]